MKKIFALLLVALCAISVDAQIVSSNSSMTVYTTKQKAPKADKSGYNRISLSYAGMKYKFDGEKVGPLKGLDLGYDHGWKVARSLPLYIEGGVHLQVMGTEEEQEYTDSYLNYNNYSNSYYPTYYTYTRHQDYFHIGVNVPVSVTYRYSFGKAFVAPLFGLHLKVNALDDVLDSTDEDDHRVQVGCQVGVNFGYKKLNVQLGYMNDFTTIVPETKTGTFYAGIGINF